MPSTTKQDKKAVKYSPGMPESHCAICRHFSSSASNCSLVAGRIDPKYWCTLFHKIKGRLHPAL